MNIFLATSRRLWKLWYTWVPVLLFGASLSANVYLLWLKSKSPVQATNSSSTLQVGQKAPVLNAEDLSGRKLTINWDKKSESPEVVYVFRESCTWCARNMANIKALSADPKFHNRIIGLSLSDDDLQGYVDKNLLTFPVYKSVVGPGGKNLKAEGTPETFLISSKGVVTDHWLGAYNPETQKDIEQKLNVHLPGLPTSSSYTPPSED